MKKIDINRNSIMELDEIVEQMCTTVSLDKVWHRAYQDAPMPSLLRLSEIMDRLRAVIFPGYFGVSKVREDSMRYHLSANLDSIYHLLADQIRRGACFVCHDGANKCPLREEDAYKIAMLFMKKIPEIRRLLSSDAKAAYQGDPAATSAGETIFCYPSLYAMIHHRIAHELYNLSVPIIPRIISEMAHSFTGIDINPGAKISEDFFIDHGTGVVIGETCIIGKGCRLYQGVTLGALSFPKDKDGTVVKGEDRHPILEDNVIVYAGTTILGRVTVGTGSIIGGNVWLTEDVLPYSKVMKEMPKAITKLRK